MPCENDQDMSAFKLIGKPMKTTNKGTAVHVNGNSW